MIKLEEKNDQNPVCPHCKQTIQNIWYKELAGFLGRRYRYFCSACSSVLGVSHRKGFFMG